MIITSGNVKKCYRKYLVPINDEIVSFIFEIDLNKQNPYKTF